MMPASCAIAAYAPVMTCSATTSSDVPARAIRPVLRLITTCRWANRPACHAASAWLPVLLVALIDKPLTLPVLQNPRYKGRFAVSILRCGCSITYTVDTQRNTILQVAGRESPVNHSRLCVKGRYGFDYAHHQERLVVPLIRKPEHYPKAVEGSTIRAKPSAATWDEALDMAAQRFDHQTALWQPGIGGFWFGQMLQ